MRTVQLQRPRSQTVSSSARKTFALQFVLLAQVWHFAHQQASSHYDRSTSGAVAAKSVDHQPAAAYCTAKATTG
jgi:hypothetical protein